ncbi:phosphoglucomutase [Tindallia californiensis]|uniref:Phosphoglucomutase n=1 Tax=Tindallia californiensis TaxID=159292 RepID=A0A1H3LFI1_9FIRM|nr:phosphoglucomutase [Tindallia californiensis]
MDKNIIEKYERWKNDPYFDKKTQEELIAIEGNEKEIEDRFFQDLAFGTGGLRGVIGAGTNRMNIYTIRKATQGLADYIKSHGDTAAARGVVIAHDCRHFSREFTLEAASVLAGNHIKTYIFDDLRPTPELSFALRELEAIAGIVVTASHNPPEYNGFKVYWEDGAQVATETAEAIMESINQVEEMSQIKQMPQKEAIEKELQEILGKEMDKKYMDAVLGQSLRKDGIQRMADGFKVVYTPLHGTGTYLVPEILRRAGFKQVITEPKQSVPDPDFSTVKSPNPEEKEAFTLAIQLAEKEKADLIIGTDPDGDRVGALVKDHEGKYQVLTGNQTGALLVEYILRSRRELESLPLNPLIVKTIVTSEMGAKIAENYGVDVENTLTGFKYIGDRIKYYEERGNKTFLMGWEESYGYLVGTYARDKDAIVAALLIAEMAAVYALEGKTLYDALLQLYQEYGTYRETLKSITLKGKEGMEKITSIMNYFRNKTPDHLGKDPIQTIEDYKKMPDFPSSNVIKLMMSREEWVCLRPSGTEPKLKIYAAAKGKSIQETDEKLQRWVDDIEKMIAKI